MAGLFSGASDILQAAKPGQLKPTIEREFGIKEPSPGAQYMQGPKGQKRLQRQNKYRMQEDPVMNVAHAFSGGDKPSADDLFGPASEGSTLQADVQRAVGVPIRVTSEFRTPEKQAALKRAGRTGATFSYHNSDNAIDFIPKGISTAEAVRRIRKSGIPTAELLDEGDHVHWARKPTADELFGPAQ